MTLIEQLARHLRDLSGMGDINVDQAAREVIRLMAWTRLQDIRACHGELNAINMAFEKAISKLDYTLPPDDWDPSKAEI